MPTGERQLYTIPQNVSTLKEKSNFKRKLSIGANKSFTMKRSAVEVGCGHIDIETVDEAARQNKIARRRENMSKRKEVDEKVLEYVCQNIRENQVGTPKYGRLDKRHLRRIFQQIEGDLFGEECATWFGFKDRGYARLKYGTDNCLVHVLMYLNFIGDLPEDYGTGRFVCHTCIGNPSCVNPFHMYIGTQQDNMDDRADQGREYRCIGEARSNKLDEEAIRAIREDSREYIEIASSYGVKSMTISKIKRGITWKKVV